MKAKITIETEIDSDQKTISVKWKTATNLIKALHPCFWVGAVSKRNLLSVNILLTIKTK